MATRCHAEITCHPSLYASKKLHSPLLGNLKSGTLMNSKRKSLSTDLLPTDCQVGKTAIYFFSDKEKEEFKSMKKYLKCVFGAERSCSNHTGSVRSIPKVLQPQNNLVSNFTQTLPQKSKNIFREVETTVVELEAQNISKLKGFAQFQEKN